MVKNSLLSGGGYGKNMIQREVHEVGFQGVKECMKVETPSEL